MSTSSFSALKASLTASEYGCTWSQGKGLQPLHDSSELSARIVVIGQCISSSTLHQLLIDLSTSIYVKSVRANQHNHLSTCFAIDIGIDPVAERSVFKSTLEQLSDKYLLDLVYQEAIPSLSSPGLLVMDMDSTMIQIECIDEIARLANRYEQVAAVTAQAMNGQLAFSDSLKTRVACLKGVEVAALEQIKLKLPLMPGLLQLVTVLRQNNWKVAIASGGFTYFADYLKQWLDLDCAVSNTLEIDNGSLTGKTIGQIIDAEVKANTLKQLAEQWAIDLAQTCAIGDGANDLKMLAASALGVAFHAKPSVKQQANYVISGQPLDAFVLLLRP